MQKGFNSDIEIDGDTFHVQTEDWGVENPYLVTRVFRSGAIVLSRKIDRESALSAGPVDESKAIGLAMREQHQEILDLLLSGQPF